MKTTTAQKFGSSGKSFKSPSAAAAVIGAALLASGTTDTAETAWSPAAACLLPDVLPVAGTLLSYGGSRQLAAGGTVSHSGSLSIGANALTCGAITASGNISGVTGSFITLGVSSGTSTFYQVQIAAGNSYFWNGRSQIASPSDGVVAFKNNAGSADAALTCGAITASGLITASVGLESNSYVISNTGRFFSRNNSSQGYILGASDDCNMNRIGAGIIGFGTGATGSTAAEIRCGAVTASGAITASGNISGVTGSFITLGVSSGTSTFYQVQIAAGNSYFWNGRSQIASPSDGVVAFKNNAGSADAALTCGAITASGLITASVGLESNSYVISNTGRFFSRNNSSQGYILGASDDCNMNRIGAGIIGFGTGATGSTAAEIRCGAVTASGLITASVGLESNSYVISNTGRFFSRNNSSQGYILGASDDCNMNRIGAGIIGFGTGATGSTAAEIRCGAVTASGGITASGAIQETPKQSSLNPTTTDIPSGKRMGWYNSTLSEFRDWVNIGGTLYKSAAYT